MLLLSTASVVMYWYLLYLGYRLLQGLSAYQKNSCITFNTNQNLPLPTQTEITQNIDSHLLGTNYFMNCTYSSLIFKSVHSYLFLVNTYSCRRQHPMNNNNNNIVQQYFFEYIKNNFMLNCGAVRPLLELRLQTFYNYYLH